jgi:predicted MFS family arabinose efflux permease
MTAAGSPNSSIVTIPVAPVGDKCADSSAAPPPPDHSFCNVCTASLAHFAFIFTNRRTFVTIIYSALMSYTMNLPAAAIGQWLRLEHGYDAEAVGWISFVMGGGEMIGLLLVASLSARVGLERSVWTGAALLVLSQVSHIHTLSHINAVTYMSVMCSQNHDQSLPIIGIIGINACRISAIFSLFFRNTNEN